MRTIERFGRFKRDYKREKKGQHAKTLDERPTAAETVNAWFPDPLFWERCVRMADHASKCTAERADVVDIMQTVAILRGAAAILVGRTAEVVGPICDAEFFTTAFDAAVLIAGADRTRGLK